LPDRPEFGTVAPLQSELAEHVTKEPDPKHHSAAELLGDWRAAERDTVAARTAAQVAALAVAAADAAEQAAAETEVAAQAAMDAAVRAKGAAEHAKEAAARAAQAAQLADTNVETELARAARAVTSAELAEEQARDRFHDAQVKGFPKDAT
jgi:chromosome segregation protein